MDWSLEKDCDKMKTDEIIVYLMIPQNNHPRSEKHVKILRNA